MSQHPLQQRVDKGKRVNRRERIAVFNFADYVEFGKLFPVDVHCILPGRNLREGFAGIKAAAPAQECKQSGSFHGWFFCEN
jgi:hypothetical protein